MLRSNFNSYNLLTEKSTNFNAEKVTHDAHLN